MAKDDQSARSWGIAPFDELGIHDYPLTSITGSKSTELRVQLAPLLVFVDTKELLNCGYISFSLGLDPSSIGNLLLLS